MTELITQPAWVCNDCGHKYGHPERVRQPHIATYHNGECGVCGEYKAVTQPRDFAYLDKEWRNYK